MPRDFVRGVCLDSLDGLEPYVAALPAVRCLREHPLELSGPATLLVGENGTGKSTLLEAIAVSCGFNPEGGSLNFCFSTRDTHAALGQRLTVLRSDYPEDGFFLRSESLYTLSSYLEDIDRDGDLLEQYGGRSLHTLSHGEGLLQLVRQRFRGRGLYILDEPETALSPARQMALLVCLKERMDQGAQLLMPPHSPLLMALPGARLYELSAAGITPRRYTDTESFQLLQRFFRDPESLLRQLLSSPSSQEMETTV